MKNAFFLSQMHKAITECCQCGASIEALAESGDTAEGERRPGLEPVRGLEQGSVFSQCFIRSLSSPPLSSDLPFRAFQIARSKREH